MYRVWKVLYTWIWIALSLFTCILCMLFFPLLYQYIESYSNSHFIAEKAFFDPSLLELLYFPEDQKYVSDSVSSSWYAQKPPKKLI